MFIKRSQEETRLIVSRRDALITAGIAAASAALAACANESQGDAPEPAQGDAASVDVAAVAGVTIDDVVSKLDAEWGFNLIQELSQIGNDGCEMGFRNAGSTGEKKCRDRLVEIMKEIGLEVTVDTYPVDGWEFNYVNLEVGGETIQLSALAGTPGTDGPLSTEIVECGDGTILDFEGKDLEGKIALVHFDVMNYWFTGPAYQAELAGAKAIIVDTIGGFINAGDDTLWTVDCGSRDAIPILCISKNDNAKLMSMMQDGRVECTLDASIIIDHGAESANICGMIPGRDGTDQNILFGAHYDGYFHAFCDDLFGVMTILNVAKAMIEAGYQPEHNLIFVAYGSEEYGVSNRYFDFCTGVWNQIHNCRPEWVGKSIAHFEVDGVRPDADIYNVYATPEYHTWFNETLVDLQPPKDPYVNGFSLQNQGGPWNQDYEMEIAGVPGLTAGKCSNSQWYSYHYHSSDSCAENDWNENVYSWLSEQYVRMSMAIDSCTIAPLDFTTVSDQVTEGFDVSLAPDADKAQAYLDALATMRDLSTEHYKLLSEVNAAVMSARAAGIDISSVWERLVAENKALLDAYKLIQHDILKLTVFSTVAYHFDIHQSNVALLAATLDALKANDGETALSEMLYVDSTYMAGCFTKEVFDFAAIELMDPNRDDLLWANDKVPQQINTYDAYHAISDKVAAGGTDFSDEVAMVEALLAEENDIFAAAIDKDTEVANSANEILTASTLQEILDELKGLLQ